jgi:diguanylate cyclase (GGDEF)-like protein/PAS domain S-box-containing protein
MQVNGISLFVLLCGLVLVAIAVFAWQRRAIRGAFWFSLFMLAQSIYVIGYFLELSSLDLASMLFWNKFQYLGVMLFPQFYLFFTLQYSQRIEKINRKYLGYFFLIPALLFIIKISDNSLHLFYSTVRVDYSASIPLLAFTPGPVYYFTAFFNLAVLTYANYLLWAGRRNSSSLYRKQTSIMLAAALIIYLVYFFYLSGYRPFPFLRNIDFNPFIYTAMGAAVGWAILRHRLFDLVPFARDTLIETLAEGVLVFDAQFRLVDANPACRSIFGWKIIPLGWEIEQVFVGWQGPLEADECIRQVLGNASNPIEISSNRDGKVFCYDINVTNLQAEKGEIDGCLLVMHDITARKIHEQQLRDLSLEDELTGLKNRRGFFTLAEQMIQMVFRMDLSAVLVYIDLDELKTINDNLGHAEGDRAIVAAAESLVKTCRSSDINARMGGDEFVILAIGSEANLAEIMVGRIDEQLKLLQKNHLMPFKLSFSYGISFCRPGERRSLVSLISEADHAMYEQKHKKKTAALLTQ